MIIDNFIKSFTDLREASLSDTFNDEINEIDGVIYPLISTRIPPEVYKEVVQNLDDLLKRTPDKITMFMRRSPKGVGVPNMVHSDRSMGTMGLLLYINESPPEGSGTSFMTHIESGIAYSGTSPGFNSVIANDKNIPEAWAVNEHADMKPNRALIFQASRLHMAAPTGGFGETKEDARVILICFFS